MIKNTRTGAKGIFSGAAAVLTLAILSTGVLSAGPAAAKPTSLAGRRPEVAGVTVSPTKEVVGVASAVQRTAAAMPASTVVEAIAITGSGTASLTTDSRRSTTQARAGFVRAGSLPIQIGVDSRRTDTDLRSVQATSLAAPTNTRLGAAAAFRLFAGGKSAAGRRYATSRTNAVRIRLDYATLARSRSADWAARAQLVSYPGCAADLKPAASCLVPTPLQTSIDPVRKTMSAVAPLAASAVVAAAAGGSGGGGDFTASPLAASGQWAAGGNSGDFSWSYAIDPPDVAGGLAPDLKLSYSSSAVDGHATSTNNQPSWVGEGWSFDFGSIERQYKACQDDMGSGTNNAKKTGDLCWDGDHATLAFGSHSGELVRDGSSRQWRLRNDDGTRIELLTTPWDNGDDDREYWKVTTPDGTQYRFGFGKPNSDGGATHSVWTVPVAGNNSGEPCHASDFKDSFCNQGWKWNLDSIVDVSGNSLTAFYQNESNRYGENNNDKSVTYDRGGYMTRIEYGTRTGTEGQAKAPAQVVFSTAERCLPTSTEKCTSLTVKNNLAWPDVPQDQLCDSTSSCSNRTAPTFFTRKRLTQISTQILSGASYTEVQRWNLTQSFPSPGDGTSAALWLSSITRSAAGGASPLPPVVFAGTQMASRVDGVEDTLGKSSDPFNKWRISGVSTESGLDLLVTYTPKDCTPKSLPSSPENNTRRCFPVWFTPPGGTKPGRHWFHKYVVTKITEHDLTNSSPLSTVLNYSYMTLPAWTYDDNPLIKAKYRTWSKWAGYGRVRTVTGNPTAATALRTEVVYYRGLDGDRAASSGGTKNVSVTDSEGTKVDDARRLAGLAREQITYSGIAGAEVSGSISDQTVLRTTADDGDHKAELAAPTRVRARTALSSGGNRRTELITSYDSMGYPTQVDDRGDVSIASDDQCKRVSYVRNEATWIVTRVSREQARTGSCSNWPNTPTEDNVISDSRLYYDGLPFGDVGDGRLTKTEVASRVDGNDLVYQVASQATYDALGRGVDATDALGRTTTTAYSPAAAGILIGMTVTSPDPDGPGPLSAHVTSSTIDPKWGKPTKSVAPGGETTEAAYDAYGRTTAVWLPGRARTASPSKKFGYLVSKTAASAVVSQELVDSYWLQSYVTTVELFDGLGRSKQTQTQQIGSSVSANGAVVQTAGRTVADTVYDDRGLAVDERGPIFATGAPATKLVAVADTAVPRMTSTTYDGAGRAIVSTLKALGKVKWSTTTAYGGDRVTVTPPIGGTASTTITDAQGRTSSVRQYLGGTPAGSFLESQYVYDSKDRLTGFSDPAGNRWSYDYDLLGRQIKASDPDTGTTTRTYDAAGQLITTRDARGVTLAYTYDALGRKTSLRDDDPTVGALRASWSYDQVKRGYLDSSSRWIGDQQIVQRVDSRDVAGRPLQTSTVVPQIDGWVDAPLAKTYTASQTYQPDGAPSLTELPAMGTLSAETIHHFYDTLGRPNGIGGNGSYVGDTLYSGFGEMLQLAEGMHEIDTTWVTREYDEGTGRLVRNRFDRNLHQKADLDIRYTFSDGGTLTKIAASHPETGAAADNQCFGYDGLQRLTRAWTPADGDCAKSADAATLGGPAPYSRGWAYDAASNRTSQTDYTGSKAVTTWQRPAAGGVRPHAATSQTVTPAGGAPVTTQLSYDAAGNTVNRSGTTLAVFGAPAMGQTMTYSAENRLEKVVQGGSTVTYADDADGGKLLRRDERTTTLYLGDTELILDRSTNQLRANRYIQFVGMTVAVVTGSGPHSAMTQWSDLNNTASWQVDNDGSKITEQLTMPFGEVRGKASPLMGTHGFVGGTNDTTANLVRVGARDYDPAAGTFLSPDPIIDLNDPTQWNPYSYGNGNPLTRSDPTGSKPKPNEQGQIPFLSPGSGGSAGGSGLGDIAAMMVVTAAQAYKDARYLYNNGESVVADRWTGNVYVDGLRFGPEGGRRGSIEQNYRVGLKTHADILAHRAPQAPQPAFIGYLYGINTCIEAQISCHEMYPWRDRLKLKSCGDGSCNQAVDAIPLIVGPAMQNRLVGSAQGPRIPSVTTSGLAEGAGACSFTGSTVVLMADGSKKPIRAIRMGDFVSTRNPGTRKTSSRKVTHVFSHLDLIIGLHIADETIWTTRNHPFWSATHQRFEPAGDLKSGDSVVTSSGIIRTVGKLETSSSRLSTAYNLEVDQDHTYFVGELGILVHNKCTIPWSSASVGRAANLLERGAESVTVASRSQAEEIFLGQYQGLGYHNTTGWTGKQVRDFYWTKNGTYHWDTEMTPGLKHSDAPHLQIHNFDGSIQRIFFSGE